MKQIPLTKGKVAIVDDEDFDRLNAHKWYALEAKRRCGRAPNFYGARCSGGRRSKVHHLMHREIMGVGKGMQVDHRDGNGLNNRRGNLRVATQLQNLHNTEIRIGKGGYRGVNPATTGRFYARITFAGKVQNLGYFATAEEAARARDRKAIELMGDFARLNFPRSDYEQQVA